MRAILVACTPMTVTTIVKEVDIKVYTDYYGLIGADLFDVVRVEWHGHDISIYLDDEGLLKPNHGRLVQGYHEPLFGNLVITGGVNAEGDTLPLPDMFTVETIQNYMTGVMYEVAR